MISMVDMGAWAVCEQIGEVTRSAKYHNYSMIAETYREANGHKCYFFGSSEL